MAHFEAVVGDVGPCSSFERRHAFLTAGPGDGRRSCSGSACASSHCPGYSDYYSNPKGGHDVGRGDRAGAVGRARRSGRGCRSCSPAWPQSLGLAVMTNEARSLSHYNRSLRAFAISARVALRTRGGQGPAPGAAHQRRVADRPAARDRPRPRHPGVDRGAARGPGRRGRPRRRRAHRARRQAGARPGPAGRAALRRRLRPQPARCASEYGGDQPNEGKWSIANPGDTGEAIADRDAARRPDRPDGRGVVAAVAAHRPLRPVDARPGPPAAPHDLRRRRRAAVRATSRTRTWRSARRCTSGTRRAGRCRAG